MRERPHDKMARGPTRDKAAVDDFSEIPGVPAFADRALHDQGVLTFDDLRTADLRWVHRPIRKAIERWRDG